MAAAIRLAGVSRRLEAALDDGAELTMTVDGKMYRGRVHRTPGGGWVWRYDADAEARYQAGLLRRARELGRG
jgi:hypothetical protein